MSFPYTVQTGDTMVIIAQKFGFDDWREIYNHPDNASFRAKRPRPDQIFRGDLLQIPGTPSPPSNLQAFVSGNPSSTANLVGGFSGPTTYPPPHLIKLRRQLDGAGRPFHYMWHLLCAGWEYTVTQPFVPNLPNGLMAPIPSSLISKEVMIALFWEESFFSNVIQFPGGPAIGFGQTEPKEFWRFKQPGQPLHIPQLDESNIKLVPCTVMLGGQPTASKCIHPDPTYHRRFSDFLSVVASLGFMRYIHEDARFRNRPISSRASFLSRYGGRPPTDPTLQGILSCASALESRGHPRNMTTDQIMDALLLARTFDKSRPEFRQMLFPYGVPNQSLTYYC